jgi:hypothetical protein
MIRDTSLDYNIEQLWIEGMTPIQIADELDCHVQLVLDWMAEESLGDEEFPTDETRSYGPAARAYKDTYGY